MNTANLISALAGILFGSIGAVLLQHRLSGIRDAQQQRKNLIRGYLFQLQDSAEALSFRFQNLLTFGGRRVMTESYFAESTLYALGRVLAVERWFVLEGVYARLDEVKRGLGHDLREHRLDAALRNLSFHQYDRLALAESIIHWDGDKPRIADFREFRQEYDFARQGEAEWLEAALQMINNLDSDTISRLLDVSATLAVKLSSITELPTAASQLITEDEDSAAGA